MTNAIKLATLLMMTAACVEMPVEDTGTMSRQAAPEEPETLVEETLAVCMPQFSGCHHNELNRDGVTVSACSYGVRLSYEAAVEKANLIQTFFEDRNQGAEVEVRVTQLSVGELWNTNNLPMWVATLRRVNGEFQGGHEDDARLCANAGVPYGNQF